jgi:hypothetical protein
LDGARRWPSRSTTPVVSSVEASTGTRTRMAHRQCRALPREVTCRRCWAGGTSGRAAWARAAMLCLLGLLAVIRFLRSHQGAGGGGRARRRARAAMAAPTTALGSCTRWKGREENVLSWGRWRPPQPRHRLRSSCSLPNLLVWLFLLLPASCSACSAMDRHTCVLVRR